MILTSVLWSAPVSEYNAPTVHTLQQLIYPTDKYINNMNQHLFLAFWIV